MRISQISFCIARKRLDWADREKESQSVQIVPVWFMSERTSFHISHELVINWKTLTLKWCISSITHAEQRLAASEWRLSVSVPRVQNSSVLISVSNRDLMWVLETLEMSLRNQNKRFFPSRTSSTQKTIYTRKCNHTGVWWWWYDVLRDRRSNAQTMKSNPKRNERGKETKQKNIRYEFSRLDLRLQTPIQ